ncbi:MAG: flavin reductase [Oscillospiraceae bacterium]|nr:flavin reductase [Oscillospiraceae bacterium]
MKKDLGSQPALYPMPVVEVAAYDENGTVSVMTVAWAQICDMDKIALFIDADHKTTKNIMETKAFTVSIADVANMESADFFGIATGNKMPDKFERSGCHAVKSEFVNAPILTEYPVTLECELAEEINTEHMHAIVGKIINVSAEESVVGDKDKILPEKVNALIFDQYRNGYYAVGEKVGQAWNAGAGLMKK